MNNESKDTLTIAITGVLTIGRGELEQLLGPGICGQPEIRLVSYEKPRNWRNTDAHGFYR
jgi:hypothetical protein